MSSFFFMFHWFVTSHFGKLSISTDCANNCFTFSCHNLWFCKKEWVWIVKVVVLPFTIWIAWIRWILWAPNYFRLFFLYSRSIFAVRVIETLIDCNVHFLNQDAISWNSVSLMNINNITNNQFLDWNRSCCTVSSFVYSNLLSIDLLSEFKELLFFNPVTNSWNHTC